MAAITFHANIYPANFSSNPSGIPHGAGSGLGFYGNTYGASVAVGQYQSTTWVTNANGTAIDNYRLNNTKYMSPSGVSANSATEIFNSGLPNYYAPLNIRFTHDTAVRTQNCKLRIFDRNNINTQASEVRTEVYEVRNPTRYENAPPLAHRGTNHHGWTRFQTSVPMQDLVFTPSPGISGLNNIAGNGPDTFNGDVRYLTTDGTDHQSTRHDWYCALSSSPDTIGSKLYALYFTLEYL